MNSRKSAALAISQSINAHAFLPTFDGAADADEASRFMEGDQANGQSQNPAVLGWTQVPGFWYSQREQTNPAALRDMYRPIEEGARVMQGGQMVDRGYGGIDDRYVQYD